MPHRWVLLFPGFDIMLPKLAIALVVLALAGDFLVGVVFVWFRNRYSNKS